MNKEIFNWKEYIKNNNDLRHITNKKDAWKHWKNYGINEKRTFYKFDKNNTENIYKSLPMIFSQFNWKKYLDLYEDLSHITNKEDAWNHWINYGKNEGRIFKNEIKILHDNQSIDLIKKKINFSQFDWEKYIHLHEDLSCITNKEDAWNHWINYGENEGRQLELENIYDNINVENKYNIEDYFDFQNGNGKKNKIILFKKKYDLYGLHYFGWKGVINNYINYFNQLFLNNHEKYYNYIIKNNILFDEWIEKLLLWGNNLDKKFFLNYIQQNNYQLITFMHNPPFIKYLNKHYKKKISNDVIINDEYQLNQNLIILICYQSIRENY